jgi:predicted DNA-binding WGR domain protein
VSRDDATVTVRYGRVGGNGQTQTKSFPTAESAEKHLHKLINEKLAKGYEEVGSR